MTLASFIGLQGLSLELRPKAAGEISDSISDVLQFPLAGLPLGMLLALLLVAGCEWVLYRRPLGRRFRAVGSSPAASQRLGINTNRQILGAFVLSGLLTGVGGLMLAGKIGIGSPVTGVDFTIMSITAVVLGGARVGGGRGSLLCTLMGAALAQATSSASAFINSDFVGALRGAGIGDAAVGDLLQPGARRPQRGALTAVRTRACDADGPSETRRQ